VTADQHPVELIMARGMMSNLASPAFLVDNDGSLIFFNEPAGTMLGLTYEEAGPLAAEEWGTMFKPLDYDGNPIPVEQLPLLRAISAGRPGHSRMAIRSTKGELQRIEVCAFPVVGRTGQHGAMAIFWSED
jgi:PAS domain-containing protein